MQSPLKELNTFLLVVLLLKYALIALGGTIVLANNKPQAGWGIQRAKTMNKTLYGVEFRKV